METSPVRSFFLILLAGMLVGVVAGCGTSKPTPLPRRARLLSPDGKIEVSIAVQSTLNYRVRIDGQQILRNSPMGLEFADGTILGQNVELVKLHRESANSTWPNRWGKHSQVHDQHNELRLTLREKSIHRTFDVVFRVFNDGVAFRYSLPAQPGNESFILKHDRTEFAFVGDYPCFAGQQGGFGGPQEWEFRPAHLSDVKPDSIIGLPLLIQSSAAWIAVTEADLRDWSGMWLGALATSDDGVTLTTKLAPRKDEQGLVKATFPHDSPWRVLMIGRQPGRLVESDLILNLAQPCLLSDTSWVRPGMAAWDWWSGLSSMTTKDMEEHIQFASDMGWAYDLIDAGWYVNETKPDADITKVIPAVDMDELLRFAREKNVRLWVWMHWTDVDRNDAHLKAFPLYEKWGIAGVKIDFMDRDDQDMVNWYEKITKAAAEHHLMVDFHGAFKPTGFNRTYPNQITREGVLGNEYNKWSARVTAEHRVTLPFTRFLAGPGDFTPGGFLDCTPAQFKSDGPAKVQGTRCAQLALFVTLDSPLCCACDHPSHYYNQPGVDFLKVVPTVWDDTRVLDGEVTKHIVMARRSGKVWFLGGMTDSQSREISVKLDFLDKGRWKLRLWKDARDSNPEHVEIEDRVVTPNETITLKMAPAGGTVATLRPE